jgi:hypothetical protein
MLTISKIETHMRSLSGPRFVADHGPRLCRAEFLNDMAPYEREHWAKRQEATSKWLARVLDKSLAPSSSELTKTVKAVFGALSQFGPEAVNLRHLPEAVNGVHLAVVLRSTADELENTQAWKDALALAERVLVRDGTDPQDALLGMIPRR